MIVFAYATDDGGLEVFPTVADALSYCEFVDVTEGDWLFWNERGINLTATVVNTETKKLPKYELLPFPDGLELIEFISNVTYVEGRGIFEDTEEIKRHLTKLNKVERGKSCL